LNLDRQVVISLQRAINNPGCEMQRPSDWISHDPDFSCLKSSSKKFKHFIGEQKLKDYPATIQCPVHVNGKDHSASLRRVKQLT
jgi:hypothetical protein